MPSPPLVVTHSPERGAALYQSEPTLGGPRDKPAVTQSGRRRAEYRGGGWSLTPTARGAAVGGIWGEGEKSVKER